MPNENAELKTNKAIEDQQEVEGRKEAVQNIENKHKAIDRRNEMLASARISRCCR